MTHQVPQSDGLTPAGTGQPSGSEGGKKAYERPRILSREPLEAMANSCTGATGKAQGFCQTARS
jgi:hypothetical protein